LPFLREHEISFAAEVQSIEINMNEKNSRKIEFFNNAAPSSKWQAPFIRCCLTLTFSKGVKGPFVTTSLMRKELNEFLLDSIGRKMSNTSLEPAQLKKISTP
jgi:hypothetical protein